MSQGVLGFRHTQKCLVFDPHGLWPAKNTLELTQNNRNVM